MERSIRNSSRLVGQVLALLLLSCSAGCVVKAEVRTGPKKESSAPKKDAKQAKAKEPASKDQAKADAAPPASPASPSPASPSSASKDEGAAPAAPSAREPATQGAKVAPAPAVPVAPASKDEGLHLVVPVRVALASALSKIDAAVVQSTKQAWKVVSKKGKTPVIEVRYELWRDALELRFDESGMLHVTVPVRYAADVRAKVKNPLDGKWVWITKGETWGTKAEPQRLLASFRAKPVIAEDYRVKARLELVSLEHGKAPSGEVCVRAIAKACVSKASLAGSVRDHIDGFLKPRLARELEDADAKIDETLQLAARAQTLWAALHEPRSLQKAAQAQCPTQPGKACDTAAWLVVQPSSLGVSSPRMDGADLRVDLSLAGGVKVVTGARPAAQAAPLPKLGRVNAAPFFRVRTALRVPLATLGKELSQQLSGLRFATGGGAPELQVKSAVLLDQVDPKRPHRVAIVVAVSGALDGELTLHGELRYDEKKQELSVQALELAAQSKNLLAQKFAGLNRDALQKQLAQKARLRLGASTGALGKALSAALGSVEGLQVRAQISELQVQGMQVQADALVLDLLLGGVLEVALR